MSRGTPILAPNFVFCTHNIKMAFSRETTLWVHRMSRTMREIFCRNFQHFKLWFK
jgi:hypothetical protein